MEQRAFSSDGRSFQSRRGSTIAAGLAFPAMDLVVQAWDIGRTHDAAVVIADEAIKLAHHYTGPLPLTSGPSADPADNRRHPLTRWSPAAGGGYARRSPWWV